MPEPRPAGEEEDVEALRSEGDVESLLALARAYRAGTAAGGRDMKRCLEAYAAAAELGSSEASYAVALFHLTGGVVPQDLKEGATRLRSAAEQGSIPAKVYLGNLYELGIHYKADPEKADVWYRNAARGAGLTSQPGSPELAKELAELGCARYVKELVDGGSLSEEERTRLLQRARLHGMGLKLRGESPAADRPTLEAALATTEAPKPAAAAAAVAEKAKPRPAPRAQPGFAAFGYALLFALAGAGAGYAAWLGARELVAHGTPLPGLGLRTDLVFPIVFAVVGVLPATLVYRIGTVLKALLVAGFGGAVGWVTWGAGVVTVHRERTFQAFAFGLAAFLAAAFVLGLLGGTKRHAQRAR